MILIPTNCKNEFDIDSIKASAKVKTSLMGKADYVLSDTKVLKYFIGGLATLIQGQKRQEDQMEDAKLMSLPFLKKLVELAGLFGLEKAFKVTEVLSVDEDGHLIEVPAPKEIWGWLNDAIHASKAIEAIQTRKSLIPIVISSGYTVEVNR